MKMQNSNNDIPEARTLETHQVWDLPVRLFHWINVLCVLGLIAVGTVILYANELGVSEG
jgi:Ni,Fe-hydrogenase I cytochrome b subunit